MQQYHDYWQYNNNASHNFNINSWCQKVVDLLDLTFAELFYGFMDFNNNYKDCCMESTSWTLWNLTSREFYQIYQVISK